MSTSTPQHINTPTQLLLNGTKYSFSQLKQRSIPTPTTEFEKATLNFCHEWLSGKDEFVLMTSGSTGVPKGIVLKRSAMETSARGTEIAAGLKEGFTALLCLDPRYVAGKMMLVRSFVTGMNIIAVDPVANPFEKISIEQRIDFTALVPYQLQTILSSSSDREKLNNLKSVLIGGAELDAKTRIQLNGLRPSFFATYGMTETISHIALQKLNPPDEQDYFQILPSIKIDKDDRGCLSIEADYLGDEKIITNDLVEIINEKQFRWLGRFDNVINTGGVKVIPEKVEKEIASVFSMLQINNRFFITSQNDVGLGNKVTLIIEGSIIRHSKDAILEHLKEKLTKFEMPRAIKNVDAFVETATQKINRAATLAQVIGKY